MFLSFYKKIFADLRVVLTDVSLSIHCEMITLNLLTILCETSNFVDIMNCISEVKN